MDRITDNRLAPSGRPRCRLIRFVALADDNCYPVTLTDLSLASQQKNTVRLSELKAIRTETFELMSRLAQLPDDMVFFTQITREAAEGPDFLDAMKAARIKGALVGVESVTSDGLKDVYKGFAVGATRLRFSATQTCGNPPHSSATSR